MRGEGGEEVYLAQVAPEGYCWGSWRHVGRPRPDLQQNTDEVGGEGEEGGAEDQRGRRRGGLEERCQGHGEREGMGMPGRACLWRVGSCPDVDGLIYVQKPGCVS